MDTSITDNQKNLGSLIHLSTFLKYFFPFANFFAPLLLWTLNKEKAFVNEHGRQAINFQLSILLYALIVGALCIPFFMVFAVDFVSLIDAIDNTVHEIRFQEVKNLSGYILLIALASILLFGLFIFELYAVISATLRASKGEHYKYPLSISFIKINPEPVSEQNQSKNEHVS
jgi:uncharacterized Tic20 family protein